MGICVFWYPCKNIIPFNERLCRFETVQCVSDFCSPAVYLRISIAHSETSILEAHKKSDLIKRPITVECYKKELNGKKIPVFTTFILVYKNHSRDGMVVYEYNEPEDYPKEEATRPFEEFLKEVCYHHVKSLFHNHEVYTDRDSSLKAYIPKDPFDIYEINRNNNEVLYYYIKQYECIFLQYAEMISKRLQKYDNIVNKLNKRIGHQDDNGGFPGYEGLVKYGLGDFRRWFSNPEHQDEVEALKKDILKWSLFLDPQKDRISRDLSSYERRIKIVMKRLNNNAERETVNIEDLFMKTKILIGTYYKCVERKKVQPKYNFYRCDLESLNTVLSEMEIDLGIYRHQYRYKQHFYVYWHLKKLILDLNKLSRNTNLVLNKICEGASVEYSYCKTLLDSEYNWESRYRDNYTNQEYDNRRAILNIRNSIRYIETVRSGLFHSQINNIHSILDKADNVSQTTTKISYLGLAITSLSLIISLIFAHRDYSNKKNQVPNINSKEVVNSTVIKYDTDEQSSTFDYRSERRRD